MKPLCKVWNETQAKLIREHGGIPVLTTESLDSPLKISPSREKKIREAEKRLNNPLTDAEVSGK